MPAPKIVRLHRHAGTLRTVHVAFVLTLCERVPVDVVKLVVQDILFQAGASDRAVQSVTVVAFTPPTQEG